MHIRRVVIRNFRAIRHLDIVLPAGLTCLVGENNTGKTTILHALRLVLDVNLPSSYRQMAREDFSYGVDPQLPDQIVVAVELTNYSQRVESEALVSDWAIAADVASLCYRFRPHRRCREDLQVGLKVPGQLTLDDYDWELASAGPHDPATMAWDDDLAATARFDRLAAFQVTFLPALRDVDDDLRRARHSPLNKLLDALSLSEAQKEAILDQLRAANKAVKANPSVSILGTQIQTALKATIGDTFAFGVDVGVADPTFASIVRSLVLLITCRGLADADPSRNGLGLNNALYMSMLIEVFKVRAGRPNVAGQLLLVEEPEAHIHPELQRVVFSGLQASGCQVLATTHSTHITSLTPLRNVVALTPHAEPYTQSVVPCVGCNLTADEERDLERYLDATRSTLLFSRRVVLVEGMSEVFMVPPLVKRVLGIDLQREGISVVPIHGTHFTSFAKLFQSGGLAKKCVALVDGDFTPRDAAATTVDPDDEPVPAGNPALTELKSLEGPFFRVFHCHTTFELEIATKSNLPMFASAANALGASIVSQRLLATANNPQASAEELSGAAKMVLRRANLVGKARFAQVASLHVGLAAEIPDYIANGLAWLRA